MTTKQAGRDRPAAGADQPAPKLRRHKSGNGHDVADVIDILPVGYYVHCPHCQRELRIARKYSGEQVLCKFCKGAFQFERSDPSGITQAFFTDCPHCTEEIRIAKKYMGMTVSCKHCDGKLNIQETRRQSAFRIEHADGTLIVIPQGDAKQFRYKDLHVQANSVQDQAKATDVRSLLIDLGAVVTLSSTMIDAVVKLARSAANSGKPAAFCNASQRVQKTLASKKLDAIWQVYDSRAAALDAVSSSQQG